MRPSRARRRRQDLRKSLSLPVGAIALLTWLGTLHHPLTGFLLGAVTALGAAALLIQQRKMARQELPDLDRLLVERTLSPSTGITLDEERALSNASSGVRDAVQRTLDFVRDALDGENAFVLWRRSGEGTLEIREHSTGGVLPALRIFDPSGTPFASLPPGGQILSAATLAAAPLPWISESHVPGTAIATPIIRDGVRVGILYLDRTAHAAPLEASHLRALRQAADQIATSIHLELLVLEAASTSRLVSTLNKAASRLNRALGIQEVCRETHDLLQLLVNFEEFIVTETLLSRGAHRLLYSATPLPESWKQELFDSGDDLVSRVVERAEVLPYDGRNPSDTNRILGINPLPGRRSLLIFPLLMPQGVIGTIILTCRKDGAFGRVDHHQVSILIHHVAAALSNALAYRDMEQMATTDGLTGLLNQRTFKERAGDAIARARRSERPLSLIVGDIDFFKSVNDTHGHAAGDEVLRDVAATLATTIRDVDIPGRWGGEEFVVLLEDTDAQAAAQLAERIRIVVSELGFRSDSTDFSVTMSLGIAALGDEDLGSLFEKADAALYAAKSGGRNRVIAHTELGGAAGQA